MPITKRLHPKNSLWTNKRKQEKSIPIECFHFDHLRTNFSFECFKLLNLFFHSLDISSKSSHSMEFFIYFLQELNKALMK